MKSARVLSRTLAGLISNASVGRAVFIGGQNGQECEQAFGSDFDALSGSKAFLNRDPVVVTTQSTMSFYRLAF